MGEELPHVLPVEFTGWSSTELVVASHLVSVALERGAAERPQLAFFLDFGDEGNRFRWHDKETGAGYHAVEARDLRLGRPRHLSSNRNGNLEPPPAHLEARSAACSS